jgi:phospho-N-acetylmuramoyl-pentapeptide-transferase
MAAGNSAIVFTALAILAYVSSHIGFAAYLNIMYIPGIQELVVFAFAMIGALIGFLWHNAHPAKMYMGDTGSLFLGGAIAGLAFAYDMPLILIFLCVMFILETLSDIIQVGYYKLSHGKRVFKMAPFHHHLEMGGWTGRKWKEKELFVLYTGVSLLCMVLSFLMVYERF